MVKEFYIDDERGIPTEERTIDTVNFGVKLGDDVMLGEIDKDDIDNYKNILLNLGFKQVWRIPYLNFDVVELDGKISKTENQIKELQNKLKGYQIELQDKLKEADGKKKNRCNWFDTKPKNISPFTTFGSDDIADYFK